MKFQTGDEVKIRIDEDVLESFHISYENFPTRVGTVNEQVDSEPYGYVGKTFNVQFDKDIAWDVPECLLSLVDGTEEHPSNGGAYDAPEYSGESLPPIGTICTAQHLDENIIRRVEVMAYKHGYVWLLDLDGLENVVYVACDLEFEPIKSEKQKEIDEFRKDLDQAMDIEEPWSREVVEILYNCGYRKTEQ